MKKHDWNTVPTTTVMLSHLRRRISLRSRGIPHCVRDDVVGAGFTLIEVLLALTILAIGLTALLKANALNIHNASRLKEKNFAHLVAMSAIADIQTNAVKVPIGQESLHSMQFVGSTWYWKSKVSATALPVLQQITVSVSTKKTGPFTNHLIGYRYIS